MPANREAGAVARWLAMPPELEVDVVEAVEAAVLIEAPCGGSPMTTAPAFCRPGGGRWTPRMAGRAG